MRLISYVKKMLTNYYEDVNTSIYTLKWKIEIATLYGVNYYNSLIIIHYFW